MRIDLECPSPPTNSDDWHVAHLLKLKIQACTIAVNRPGNKPDPPSVRQTGSANCLEQSVQQFLALELIFFFVDQIFTA